MREVTPKKSPVFDHVCVVVILPGKFLDFFIYPIDFLGGSTTPDLLSAFGPSVF